MVFFDRAGLYLRADGLRAREAPPRRGRPRCAGPPAGARPPAGCPGAPRRRPCAPRRGSASSHAAVTSRGCTVPEGVVRWYFLCTRIGWRRLSAASEKFRSAKDVSDKSPCISELRVAQLILKIIIFIETHLNCPTLEALYAYEFFIRR